MYTYKTAKKIINLIINLIKYLHNISVFTSFIFIILIPILCPNSYIKIFHTWIFHTNPPFIVKICKLGQHTIFIKQTLFVCEKTSVYVFLILSIAHFFIIHFFALLLIKKKYLNLILSLFNF